MEGNKCIQHDCQFFNLKVRVGDDEEEGEEEENGMSP